MTSRRSLIATAALTALAFARIAGAADPLSDWRAGVNYRLVAQHSGKAADINGASTAAGARLIQWAPGSGLNQQFDFLPSDGGHYRIRARHSGLVLQVASNSTGPDE